MGKRKEIDPSALTLINVEPKTENQAEVLHELQRKCLNFIYGPAGSGKTFLAIYQAMRDLVNGKSKKIYLTRPAIEASGEELGYLPGDLEEKMQPYLIPLLDSIDKMLGDDSGVSAQDLIEIGLVEIAPLAYMRGRDLWNCTLVCDEAQNTTKMQMLMLLTRAGKRCNMYVVGDDAQRDVQRSNGFLHAIRVLVDSPMIGITQLGDEDIQRSPIVREVLRLWNEVEEWEDPEPADWRSGLTLEQA